MTGAKDNRLYLDHILSCIERVLRYTAGGRESFLADDMAQDAVVRNLQTLAESTQRLSAELKARHPCIDWRRISQFRNFVVHAYMDIKYERIWLTVEQQLGLLERVVRQSLADMDATAASEE